ncbi:MAG: phenylalanine 4-monooxygenase [Xanthomonadales bacterium]|nr:phenylalanine 4-monooxygenase [Xanthomonadales bacterium]
MQLPKRVEHAETDRGAIPVYATGVVAQPWDSYSATDHDVWKRLFARQREVLKGRACDEFIDAQNTLGISADTIPRFSDINDILRDTTHWELIGVEGLLPEQVFFDHLANRRFPVTWWIRRPDQFDYISEPDLFHDLFGHVPLLINPLFADYMQAYGRGGLKAEQLGPEALINLTRLYWYTVEFGLIHTAQGLRIYGSGIVSSQGESVYSLESAAPNRIGFDLERIMRTQYRIDTFQQTYFVIDGFEQLIAATQPDFTPTYARLKDASALPARQVLDSDHVYQRGNGAGWADGGDV